MASLVLNTAEPKSRLKPRRRVSAGRLWVGARVTLIFKFRSMKCTYLLTLPKVAWEVRWESSLWFTMSVLLFGCALPFVHPVLSGSSSGCILPQTIPNRMLQLAADTLPVSSWADVNEAHAREGGKQQKWMSRKSQWAVSYSYSPAGRLEQDPLSSGPTGSSEWHPRTLRYVVRSTHFPGFCDGKNNFTIQGHFWLTGIPFISPTSRQAVEHTMTVTRRKLPV